MAGCGDWRWRSDMMCCVCTEAVRLGAITREPSEPCWMERGEWMERKGGERTTRGVWCGRGRPPHSATRNVSICAQIRDSIRDNGCGRACPLQSVRYSDIFARLRQARVRSRLGKLEVMNMMVLRGPSTRRESRSGHLCLCTVASNLQKDGSSAEARPKIAVL